MKNALLSLFLLSCCPLLCKAAQGEDLVVYLERPEARVMLVIPAGVDTVRGILLHGPNKERKPDARWTELARSLQFAHMVCSIDMKRNNRPRRLRENVPAALNELAELLDRPELKSVPLAPTGHSAGGMTLSAMAGQKGRLLTGANDCSWIYKTDHLERFPHMAETPLLFVIGAIPDDFKMIPAIEAQYDPAREGGATWALGFEWGKAHSFGNAGTLFASWFKAVATERIPEEGNELKAIPREEGWLGSREDWDRVLPTIAPYSDYAGDREEAVWLPNRAFAYTWRAYQSKGSPWQLQAQVGEKRSREVKEGKKRELRCRVAEEVTLSLTGDGEPGRVQFFHDDQLIGESSEVPFRIVWKDPPAGSHALHARWTNEAGEEGLTQPLLLVVQADVSRRVMRPEK